MQSLAHHDPGWITLGLAIGIGVGIAMIVGAFTRAIGSRDRSD